MKEIYTLCFFCKFNLEIHVKIQAKNEKSAKKAKNAKYGKKA